MSDRSPAFYLAVLVGGLVFGFGLAYSHMARPEVVLNFLQFEDFGLLFVMGGASVVTAITFAFATNVLDHAPLTGADYVRRMKSFDRNVLAGGVIFGVGWGLSGICPGAAYASVGIGNFTILWAIGGMFAGAYLQGLVRSRTTDSDAGPTTAD
ncbi:YeeE/YedE family protein [Halorientalis marina]|uniref:YeeE/YedE family protein n=1 Tax=Halorientalis marina TaxID=2931976 RepID=UPI001FF176DF|nr:YeeE/YedE family protein [Halorientalis marina]